MKEYILTSLTQDLKFNTSVFELDDNQSELEFIMKFLDKTKSTLLFFKKLEK